MFEIFKQEQIDGLSDKLSNTSIAYTLDLVNLDDKLKVDVDKWIATAGINQPDLFYMDSILVTLGWNLNDDIFLKEEVYPARNTPVDKPFNKMHNQEEIIGHMTASRLLDSNYNIVEDNFEHIAVSSVIYKAWRDETKQDEINQIIAQINDGKWKVSMECLFNKFDYGIIMPDGSQAIIERTPETSYLTKHLRAYNGSGSINGKRIGRVLRNITFCGKGLVDNPGNPYSIIFNKSEKFFGAKASLTKEFVMNELELAKAELDKIKSELSAAQAEAKRVAEEKTQAAIAELNETIKSKDESLAALQADFTKLTDNLAKAKADLEASEQVKAEAIKGFEAAKAELDKIKTETVIAQRKAALASVVGPDRVSELLDKFANASQEMFDSLLSTLSAFKPVEKETKDEDKKEGKEEAKAVKTIEADLAKAELDKDIPLHSTASKTDDAMKNICDYLTGSLSKNVNKKGAK